MKHIYKFNESMDIKFPIDNGYKRLNNTEAEKVEFKYLRHETPEKKQIIEDVISKLFSKIDNHKKLRGYNEISYYDHRDEVIFITIISRQDDWYIIEIQTESDLIKFLCDNEFGLNSFEKDWEVNNPYLLKADKKINENYSFPKDGSYIQFNSSYMNDLINEYGSVSNEIYSKEMESIENKINMIPLSDIKPFSRTNPNSGFDYVSDYTRNTISVLALGDNWVIVMLQNYKNLRLYTYLCDGFYGLNEFIEDWNPIESPSITQNDEINENIMLSEFISDKTYIKLPYHLFRQVENENENLSSINHKYAYAYDLLAPLINKHITHDNFWLDIYEFEDEYVIVEITLNETITRFLCDSEKGIEDLSNDLMNDLKIEGDIFITENVDYPMDASFIEMSDEQYNSFIFNSFDIGDDEEVLSIIQSYLHNNGYNYIKKHKQTISFRYNGVSNLIDYHIYEDYWITILSFQGVYLCDGILGLEEFLKSGFLLSTNQLNENIENNIDEGSFKKMENSDLKYVYNSFSLENFNDSEIEDFAEDLGKGFNVSKTAKANLITVYEIKERNKTNIYKFSDGWCIAKDEYDERFLCDQLDGVVKLLKK